MTLSLILTKVKCYLKDYQSIREAKQGIGNYLAFYNHDRLHQSLNYLTPVEVHFN
ncbi:IS3 family transposase [bacterium]|nr:IS3 family transposase [bacterium]MBU2599392.1 IS3 family transposase [bacterium]